MSVIAIGNVCLFVSVPHLGALDQHRTQDDRATNQHQLLEVLATYPSNFDAAAFLDSIRKTVAGCQRQVAAWGDDGIRRAVDPAPLAVTTRMIMPCLTPRKGLK